MSLTRQIAGNTLAQIISKMGGAILGVAAIMIMARYLGAEKFGWYATAIGFFQFIFLIFDFSFTLATSSMLSEPAFDKKRVFDTLFSWRLATAIIAQILGAVLIWFFPYNQTIKLGALIVSATFFLLAINQVFVGFYQARLSTYILAGAEILLRVLMIIGLFAAAYFNLGFYSTLLAILGANLVYTVLIWAKSEGARILFDKEISMALFVKIWPMALAVILNGVYLQGDRLLLPLYASQIDVGFYGAAYRVLDILTQASAIIAGLLLPLLAYSASRGEKEDFKKRYQWIFDLVMLLVMPMTLGTLILAGPIMNFVGGAEFAEAGKILWLLSIAAFGISFGMTFGHVVLSLGKQKQALWVYGSDAILSLIGYLIFIPRYGMYGAAFVTIFSEFYAGLGLAFLSWKFSGALPRLGKFFKILVASIIMAIALKFLPPVHILLQVVFGAIIYGALVLSFGVVSKNTLRELFYSKK